MKNRNGDEYQFVKVTLNTYTITGDLKYWRYGGQEGQPEIDYTNLGFVDPSGGPFISIGYNIEGRKVIRIRRVFETIYFDVGS
jgi:hypothetical protein